MNITLVTSRQVRLRSYFQPFEVFLASQRIPHETIPEGQAPSFGDGVVVACDLSGLKGLSRRHFTVLVAHDLTGLRNRQFLDSPANLNVVPGRAMARELQSWGLVARAGGFVPWDLLVSLQERKSDIRRILAESHGFPPDRPWIFWNPTLTRMLRSPLEEAEAILRRCREVDGHLLILLQADPPQERIFAQELAALRDLYAREEGLHVLEGEEIIPYIVASDLILSEVSNAALMATHLRKPLLLLCPHVEQGLARVGREDIDEFLSRGVLLQEVSDLRGYMEHERGNQAMIRLLNGALDDRDGDHCPRLVDIIYEEYDRSQEGRSRPRQGMGGPARVRRDHLPPRIEGRLPHFLGIGAQKSGTTWLYRNLSCHPDVFMSRRREPHFFDWCYQEGVEAYSQLFAGGEDRVRGEITPGYGIMEMKKIRRVRALMPLGKFILLCRNPIDRAWSQALMNLGMKGAREIKDVTEGEFIAHFQSPHSRQRGDYLTMIRRWTEVFSEEQLFVAFFESIGGRPQGLLEDIFTFLGLSTEVDWSLFPSSEVIHEGVGYPLEERYRRVLIDLYAEEIEALYQHFGEPVRPWLDALAFRGEGAPG